MGDGEGFPGHFSQYHQNCESVDQFIDILLQGLEAAFFQCWKIIPWMCCYKASLLYCRFNGGNSRKIIGTTLAREVSLSDARYSELMLSFSCLKLTHSSISSNFDGCNKINNLNELAPRSFWERCFNCGQQRHRDRTCCAEKQLDNDLGLVHRLNSKGRECCSRDTDT